MCLASEREAAYHYIQRTHHHHRYYSPAGFSFGFARLTRDSDDFAFMSPPSDLAPQKTYHHRIGPIALLVTTVLYDRLSIHIMSAGSVCLCRHDTPSSKYICSCSGVDEASSTSIVLWWLKAPSTILQLNYTSYCTVLQQRSGGRLDEESVLKKCGQVS